MAINFTDKNISSINLKDVKYNIKSIPLHGKPQDWNGVNEEAYNLNMHNYVPKDGEIIIIDTTEDGTVPSRRIKIGDGVNTVSNLPNFNSLNAGMEISDREPAQYEEGDFWLDTSEDATYKLKIRHNGEWIEVSGSSNVSEPQVQSDWAQNDETAVDYVKNRTHWVETGAVEIYNGTLNFSEISYDSLSSGSINYTNNGFEITTHPNAGSIPSEVSITIDGIKYVCPLGGYISSAGEGALSEYKVAVGDNDYLACTATYRGYNALIIICTAGLINSQFLVEIEGDRYQTLDERFIPSTIARKSDITQISTDSTLTVPGSAADAKATGDAIALKPGKVVTGETFTIDGVEVVAKGGAEIFNDLSTNIATGQNSHAEGKGVTASGPISHAEGYKTIASAQSSHAEGNTTTASGQNSHAEGGGTNAAGLNSHAEGWHTTTLGISSHAEGYGDNKALDIITSELTDEEILTAWESTKFTLAKGTGSHAEGKHTLALGEYAHAEGINTVASGDGAHAEGSNTTASGASSHAEGGGADAIGNYSHAEGTGTIASSNSSHAQGKYNIEDTELKYAHIVGNGEYNTPSNAHTLDWDGNAWFAGDVYVGSTSGTNKDDGSKKLATEEYVNEAINGVESDPVDLSKYVSKNDIIDVAHGGTGKVTHTANAVLTGNGTSAVKNVPTASGALYATEPNAAPQFGVLPYAQGGTGQDLADVPKYAIIRNAGDGGQYMWYIATGNGALYATAANGAAKFGTLPIAQGGTGATSAASARTNLGAKMKLLWTNASPTSTFASFTPLANADLAESLANFTAIMIWFNITPESTQHAPFVIPIGIGSGTSTDDVKNVTLCFTTGDNKWVRRYCWATTSAITFGAGGYKTSLSANWTVNSKYMVPERIYGIR